MTTLVVMIKGLIEFAGFLLLGQGLVRVLSFGRHETNPVYRAFTFLTSPVVRAARAITPSAVVDRHVPLVAFLLLFWLWIAVIWLGAEHLLRAKGVAP